MKWFDVLDNRVLQAALFAWLIAQCLNIAYASPSFFLHIYAHGNAQQSTCRHFHRRMSQQFLQAALFAWLIAQCLKVILVFWKEKRLEWSRMVGSGGMPSSHSAFVGQCPAKHLPPLPPAYVPTILLIFPDLNDYHDKYPSQSDSRALPASPLPTAHWPDICWNGKIRDTIKYKVMPVSKQKIPEGSSVDEMV